MHFRGNPGILIEDTRNRTVMDMTEVVAALIWRGDRFLICQRPAHKARGLLWEFVGGKVEPGETKEQALRRECREELDIELAVRDVFMDVVHEYPDLTVHLTLFHAEIASGEPKLLEHVNLKWITSGEIADYAFCPADEEILKRILAEHPPRPVAALLYDFDKTLCTKDMQEYTFIPNVGMTPEAFWAESNALARDSKMDGVLAYMHVMLERAHAAKKSIRREAFVEMGRDLEFFPGVEDWFGRIDAFGDALGLQVEHYIISSGLREIIEGSAIFGAFREVFACEYLYDENDVACWPKNAVNYTTKTQFLFRINKGVLDLSNDADLNRYTPEDDRRVPFRNMIYIGDGLTDVPCMKLVKVNGGCSVAVYPEGRRDKVRDLLRHDRVNFIEPADYREGSALDAAVKDILRRIAAQNALTERTKRQLQE